MSEDMAFILGTFAVLSLPFLFFGFMRYMRYRENVALAERGVALPDQSEMGDSTLRWGLAITFVGLALCVGLYPVGWIAMPGVFPLNFGPWMLVGLVPLAFGLALVVSWMVTRERRD